MRRCFAVYKVFDRYPAPHRWPLRSCFGTVRVITSSSADRAHDRHRPRMVDGLVRLQGSRYAMTEG